jgi:NAD(P)-dependent dehydrogenase (short-subunit alcohol dehydrogenase family)
MTIDAVTALPGAQRATFDGMVAIVTGGANGMGESVVHTLADRGALVVIADKDAERSAQVEDDVRARGGDVEALVTDVKDEEQVVELFARVMSTYGRVDLLDNNAAELELTAEDPAVADVATQVFADTLTGNLLAPFLCCKHAIPLMVAAGGGRIVNMASITGMRGEMSLSAYGVSKAGVIELTRMVATQYGKQGVRCNAIAPSLINTRNNQRYVGQEFYDMYDRHHLVTHMGEPQDVASVVAFLLSDESRFINGHVIPVDGGMTAVAPFAAERREVAPS